MAISNLPLGIDKIVGWPVLVIERTPDRVVVINGHRVVDSQLGDFVAHVADDLFVAVFRGVNANHHQAILLVFLRPVDDVRQAVLAVDAVISPEIHQYHLAAQAFVVQR
ncbi:hypothetical protein D3C80_1679880 [compost metagenome]